MLCPPVDLPFGRTTVEFHLSDHALSASLLLGLLEAILLTLCLGPLQSYRCEGDEEHEPECCSQAGHSGMSPPPAPQFPHPPLGVRRHWLVGQPVLDIPGHFRSCTVAIFWPYRQRLQTYRFEGSGRLGTHV